MGEALNRGTVEGANCASCPFSKEGKPNRPVTSEFPDDPKWILLGDCPGHFEVNRNRNFVGNSGQVIDKILIKIGAPRDQLFLGNSCLCIPFQGASTEDKERAAECCKSRLLNELKRFPGKPILTLGAVAGRNLIPKPILDAIDPPDVPKSRKKAAKDKQKAARRDEKKIGRAIEKIAKRRHKAIIKAKRGEIQRELIRRYGKKANLKTIERELEPHSKAAWGKVWPEARLEFEAKVKKKELTKLAAKGLKPKKRKPIKITDIVGTLFDIDVDGSGVRPLIPAIHPASLLRGGGATIGGSHTPDMAYINLLFDVKKINDLSKGKDIRLKLDVQYEIADPIRATELFLWAIQVGLENGEASLDLETYVEDPDRHHALMAYVAKIRVIGLSVKINGIHKAISVLWDLLPNWVMSYFQVFLTRSNVSYHNGLYDRTVLRAHGFILPTIGVDLDSDWTDTLLQHHASFPGNAHNLQSVTSQFSGVAPWKSSFRNSDETPEKLALYNGADTASTLADKRALDFWIKKTETEKVYALDRHMSDIASRMHLHGIPISREVNSQLISTFSRLARDARKTVDEKANDPRLRDAIQHHLALQVSAKKRKNDPEDFEQRYGFRLAELKRPDWRWKVNSSKHIAALLLALGIPMTQRTDQGAVSTKKSVLESMVNFPIVNDILTYRQNEKMLDFVEPIFDQVYGGELKPGFADENDRIHPIWSIHKISGRWAASEPFGISNAPREKPKEVSCDVKLSPDTIILDVLCKVCKKAQGKEHDGADHAFVAGNVIIAYRPTTKRQVVCRPGRALIGFDFAQLEARILALLSGDEFMCGIFARDADLHTECSRVVFPDFDLQSPKERKMMRTVCKTLEYATWYGASDDKVWKGLLQEGYSKIKFQDVVGSLQILKRKMSGIVRWQRETIQRASAPPYELRDFVLGRRRVWPMGQVEASEALNIVPQSTGAAIMNRGMALFDSALRQYRDAFCIAQIHDAAVFECDENDAEAIKIDMIKSFTYEHTNQLNGKTVKFPIEADIGTSWNEV